MDDIDTQTTQDLKPLFASKPADSTPNYKITLPDPPAPKATNIALLAQDQVTEIQLYVTLRNGAKLEINFTPSNIGDKVMSALLMDVGFSAGSLGRSMILVSSIMQLIQSEDIFS